MKAKLLFFALLFAACIPIKAQVVLPGITESHALRLAKKEFEGRDVDNIFETEGYSTALIDMGLLDSVKSFKTKKSQNDISGNMVRFEAVTTTNVGQLRDLLGDRVFEIDSLVVNGPIDNSDIETMWSASLDGELKAINLKNAVVEGNQIPEQSFFHCDEQIDWTTGDIYVIKLRTIIFPESIDYIGRLAFGYAIHLEELKLPKSLRSIGAAAFTDCVSIWSA